MNTVTRTLEPWKPGGFLAIVIHQAAWARADYAGYCATVGDMFERAV